MLYLGLGPDEEYEDYDQMDEGYAPAAPPARSAIPTSPLPSAGPRASTRKPGPSSSTSKVRVSVVRSSRTANWAQGACLAVFCSASCDV